MPSVSVIESSSETRNFSTLFNALNLAGRSVDSDRFDQERGDYDRAEISGLAGYGSMSTLIPNDI